MAELYNVDNIREGSSMEYILKMVTSGSRVLEFGPAMGYMTRLMVEQKQCRVTGVELSAEMARHASQYAEKVIVADITRDPWEKELEGTFDIIIFADVLEHLNAPEEILRKTLPFLAKGGTLLTSVPNITHNAVIMALKKGRFNYTDYGLLDNTHIHFFTRGSLMQMFENLAMVCVDQKCVMKRPGITELRQFYFFNPWNASLIFRKDGHVYQFVCAWKRVAETENIAVVQKKGIRISFFRAWFILCVDVYDFLAHKYHWDTSKRQLPKFLKKRG